MAIKQTFDELQEEGAKKFGVNWLVMQRDIVETADLYGIDPRQNKFALAKITYRVLSLVKVSKENEAV